MVAMHIFIRVVAFFGISIFSGNCFALLQCHDIFATRAEKQIFQYQLNNQLQKALEELGLEVERVQERPIFAAASAEGVRRDYLRIAGVRKDNKLPAWFKTLYDQSGIGTTFYFSNNGRENSVIFHTYKGRRFISINGEKPLDDVVLQGEIFEAVVKASAHKTLVDMEIMGEFKPLALMPVKGEAAHREKFHMGVMKVIEVLQKHALKYASKMDLESRSGEVPGIVRKIQSYQLKLERYLNRAEELVDAMIRSHRFEPTEMWSEIPDSVVARVKIGRDDPVFVELNMDRRSRDTLIDEHLQAMATALLHLRNEARSLRQDFIAVGVRFDRLIEDVTRFQDRREAWTEAYLRDYGLNKEDASHLQMDLKHVSPLFEGPSLSKLIDVTDVAEMVISENVIPQLPTRRGSFYGRIFEQDAHLAKPGDEFTLKRHSVAFGVEDLQRTNPDGRNIYRAIIHSKSGRYVGFLDPTGQGPEILFLPGTKFRVTFVRELDKTLILEEIP